LLSGAESFIEAKTSAKAKETISVMSAALSRLSPLILALLTPGRVYGSLPCKEPVPSEPPYGLLLAIGPGYESAG
jgi:hypothetical protein